LIFADREGEGGEDGVEGRLTPRVVTGMEVGRRKMMLTKMVQRHAYALTYIPYLPIYHGPGSNFPKMILQLRKQ
jgi:hypothetical protein